MQIKMSITKPSVPVRVLLVHGSAVSRVVRLRLNELMKLAEKKLGYLRIVTPKYPDDGREAGRFVVADGAVVDGAAATVSKARHSYAAAFTLNNVQ